ENSGSATAQVFWALLNTNPTTSPTFDFSLASGGNKSVTQGQSVSNTVTATLLSGTTQAIGFTISGLPSGTTGTFSQISCNPTCSITLTISTSSTTPTGNNTISVTSAGGTVTRTSSFNLTVNASAAPGLPTSTLPLGA